jgi:hypothetical protein
MNLLFIGDVVGRPGRKAVEALLPGLKSEFELDFVVANAENAAGGLGITDEVVEELFGLGIDVLTTGNHVWKNRQSYGKIRTESRLLRPANYPPGVPGRGGAIFISAGGAPIGIINLIGRVFMEALDCPFQIGLQEVERLRKETDLILVDMHAEATSEKLALAWFLDGKVSAVLGTHTHVQTSDERLLPQGTAYITDVGMAGPRDSVLGVRPEVIIERFEKKLPVRFELADGALQLDAVVLEINNTTGKTEKIERIRRLSPS